MTNKEIKAKALEILKQLPGTEDIKLSQFTVKEARMIIKEAELGWYEKEYGIKVAM